MYVRKKRFLPNVYPAKINHVCKSCMKKMSIISKSLSGGGDVTNDRDSTRECNEDDKEEEKNEDAFFGAVGVFTDNHLELAVEEARKLKKLESQFNSDE